MPVVVREDIDNLNATLTVTITRDDLKPAINSELKKFRQKASMKGFRKGKTPLGLIKKMYGQSIMADVVNKKLEEQLNDYLTEEKLDLLGQPIPSKDQGAIDFTLGGADDLIFKFDLGLAPDMEIAGVDKSTSITRYKIEVPAEDVQADLDAALKRVGGRESVEDVIQEGDAIRINAIEMDGDAIKLDGWPTEFTVLYNDIGDEAVKADLATKKKGDTFHFDITSIEGEKSPEHIRKYLLNVEEGDEDVVIGDHFEGTITSVDRVVAAEMNQEFFDSYFGEGKITSEQEAKDFIKEDITKMYVNQVEGLMFRDIQEMLMEKNEVALPDTFLKRWLVTSNENNTPETVEKGYAGFAKSLQWTIIRGKLAKQYEVDVTEKEIADKTRATVVQYYGMYLQDEKMLDSMVMRMLQDQKHVESTYEDILVDKLFTKVKEDLTIEEKDITKADFEKVIEEARASAAAAQAAYEIGEEEE